MADPFIFPDTAWEALADHDAARRASFNRLIRSYASYETARRVADIATVYPTMAPAVVTAAGLAGLQADDNQLAELAVYMEAQKAAQAAQVPPTGNPVGRVLTTGVRLLATVADALYREVLQGPVSTLFGAAQSAQGRIDAGESTFLEEAFNLVSPFGVFDPDTQESVRQAAAQSFGQSAGAVALASYAQGRPVNLGTGLTPGGTITPETYARLGQGIPFPEAIQNPSQLEVGIPAQQYATELFNTVRPRVGVVTPEQVAAGPGSPQDPLSVRFPWQKMVVNKGLPNTPGRIVAHAFTEPGTMPFTILSGLVDLAAAFSSKDPSSALLKGLGEARTAANLILPRALPKASGATNGMRMINQALYGGGPRLTVGARTFEEWAASGHGDRTLDWFANNTSYSQISDQLDFVAKRAPDHRLAWALTAADNKAQVADLLSQAVKDGVIRRAYTPQTLTGRVLGGNASVTGALAETLGLEGARVLGARKAFQLTHPDSWLARMAAETGFRSLTPHDPDRMVRDFGEWLKVARFPAADRSQLMEEMSHAISTFDGSALAQDFNDVYAATFSVFAEGAMGSIRKRMIDAGYSPTVSKMATQVFSDLPEMKKYFIDNAGGAQYHPLSPVKVLGNGQQVALPSPQAMMTEFLERNIPLPDWRGLRVTMRRLRKAERTHGRVTRALPELESYQPGMLTHMADTLMGKVWKPLVLMRVAYPVRVIIEEQARMAAAGLSSIYHHPIHYLAQAVGRKHGSLTGDWIEESLDFQAAMNSSIFGDWRNPTFHPKYARDEMINIDANHPRFYHGAAWELEKMWNQPLARSVAAVGKQRTLELIRGSGNPLAASRAQIYGMKPQLSDPTQMMAYLESVEARLHKATGGHYWSREPGTGRWIDDFRKPVDMDNPANIATVNEAEAAQAAGGGYQPQINYVITQPGNPELISAVANRRLGDIDLTGVTPTVYGKRFERVTEILRDQYADSLPSVVYVGRLLDKADQPGLWSKTTNMALGTVASGAMDIVDRSPTIRQFYLRHIAQMWEMGDEATRRGVIARLKKMGISRPGLSGFIERFGPGGLTDESVLRAINEWADDYSTIAARARPVDDPIFTASYSPVVKAFPDLADNPAMLREAYIEFYEKVFDDVRLYKGPKPGAPPLGAKKLERGELQETTRVQAENARARFGDAMIADTTLHPERREMWNQLEEVIFEDWREGSKMAPPATVHPNMPYVLYHGAQTPLPPTPRPREPGARFGESDWPGFFTSPDLSLSAEDIFGGAGKGQVYTIYWPHPQGPRILPHDETLPLATQDSIREIFYAHSADDAADELADLEVRVDQIETEMEDIAAARLTDDGTKEALRAATDDAYSENVAAVKAANEARAGGNPAEISAATTAADEAYEAWQRAERALQDWHTKYNIGDLEWELAGLRDKIDIAKLRLEPNVSTLEDIDLSVRALVDAGEADMKDLRAVITNRLADDYDAFQVFPNRVGENEVIWINPQKLSYQNSTDELFIDMDKVRGQLDEYAGTPEQPFGSGAEAGVDEIHQHALAYALEDTKRLLYDLSRRHNFADMSKLMIPFGEAYYEIMSTWARLITENPQIPRRIQQGIEALRDNGLFYPDPDSGEEVFNFLPANPLAKWMFGGPPGGAEGQEGAGPGGQPWAGPQFTGRVSGLNLVLGNFMPGVGPLIQLPAALINSPLKNDPSWKPIRDLIFPFAPTGEEPTPGGIVNSLTPSWMVKGFTALFGDRVGGEQARMFGNTVKNVFAAMIANGEITDSQEDYQRGMATATRRARIIYAIRSLAQFVGPVGPTARFEVQWDPEVDPDGHTWTFQALSTAFREMVDANGGDQAVALDQFYATFGLDPTFFATPKTRQIKDRSVTEAGLAFQADHPDQFEDFPLTAYFGLPDTPSAEFSYDAYLAQLREGTRVVLTNDQWMEARNRLLGEAAYQYARDQVTDPNTGKMRTDEPARQWLRLIRDDLMNRYVGFGRDITGLAERADVDAMRIEFARWPDDPFFSETEGGQGLGLYLRARDLAHQLAYERHTVSPNGFGTAGSVQYLRDWLLQVAESVAMTSGANRGPNPAFVAIFERAYASEVEDPTHELELAGTTFSVNQP